MEQEQINIEDIMKEIRAEIREKGYADNEIPFSDIACLVGGTEVPFDLKDIPCHHSFSSHYVRLDHGIAVTFSSSGFLRFESGRRYKAYPADHYKLLRSFRFLHYV